MDRITLYSKRNSVYAEGGCLYKQFAEVKAFENEVEVYRRLGNTGLAVPKLVSVDEQSRTLTLEYLSGSSLLELLERAEAEDNFALAKELLDMLAVWLIEFYSICKAAYGCDMALFDAHLRNFIVSGGRLYGVDFEAAAPGCAEEDISTLLVFIICYNPMLTPFKMQCARYLYHSLSARLLLNPILLAEKMQLALSALCRRRGISISSDFIQDAIAR